MRTKTLVAFILCGLVHQYVAPPVEKEKKEFADSMRGNTDGLSIEQAQDQEYFRYLTQVVSELEKDERFKLKLNNASEDDIKSGKIADFFPEVDKSIRRKLDEIKRIEIEYQRDLIKQKKDHMNGVERNYWNPIHHDNKDSFEMEDLKKLLSKHNDMMSEQDKTRREDFKKHEMEKAHERREKREKMSDEERKKEEEEFKGHHNPKHDKMHEPGHKKQLEEVWEKEDGLDPDSFDPKTFFKLHDKNNDGHLDQYEVETMFLNDLDKVYNETDPNIDRQERDEEMERMREHVLKTMDKDNDGLVSYNEFIAETKDNDFDKDEEWKPLTEEEQFSDEEYKEYERLLAEEKVQPGGEHHENAGAPKAETHH